MFCPKCGEILRDSALRCPVCGASPRKTESQVNDPCDCDTNKGLRFQWNKTKTHSTYTSYAPKTGSARSGQPSVREFGQLILDFFRRGLDFRGRSTRWEFWWTYLFLFLVTLLLSDMLTPCLIWFLATLVPFTALGVRRLHDVGKSGWWLLVKAIPGAGVILLIYWFCQPSNRYGYHR